MSNATQQFQFYDEVTPLHINHLQTHGLIHFKQFVSSHTVKQLLYEIKQVERYLINQNILFVNGVPLRFGADVDGAPLIQRIAFASQYSTVLRNFLETDRVRQLVKLLQPFEGRIGEKEKDGLVVNHYLNTTESGFSKLGWHTDSPRDLFLGSGIKPMLNVGLHLDDCPQTNGGLRVLPGTHNKGWLTLFFRKKYFIDHQPDEKEIGLDIAAGDLTIHDGRLWHRVQQSPHIGASSRRRVMYIPLVTGAYRPKHEWSRTPFYHKIARLATQRSQKSTPPDFNQELMPSP